MRGEIEATRIGDNIAGFVIVEDSRGPEEISVDLLELVLIVEDRKDLTFSHAVDIRDYAKKADANLGLRYAEGLIGAIWRIPKEWEGKRLFSRERY